MKFLGCNEAEVIFLGCLKISWTDLPVCICVECPPGGSKTPGSVVAALLGRQVKCSNLPGRKEGRGRKDMHGKGREGKGREGKGREKEEQEEKTKRWKIGQEEQMCKKKRNCLACYQERENLFEPA